MEREALKLALEALKIARDQIVDPEYGPIGWDVSRLDEVLSIGKQALAAQPEQEPVEWLTGCPECGMDSGCDCDSGTLIDRAAQPAQKPATGQRWTGQIDEAPPRGNTCLLQQLKEKNNG